MATAFLDIPPNTQPKRLDFLVIYEDFATGVRGKHLAEQLAGELEGKWNPTEAMWRLDVLEIPEITPQFELLAEKASVVILALKGNRGMPSSLSRHVEAWKSGRQGNETRMFAVFDPEHSRPCVVRAIEKQLERSKEDAERKFGSCKSANPCSYCVHSRTDN